MRHRPVIARLHGFCLGLLRRFEVSDQTFLILLATVVGVVVGGGTYVFERMLEYAGLIFWTVLPSLGGNRTLWLLITPCIGALFLAPFIRFFPKDATTDGVPATMEAVALRNGFMRWPSSFLRMIMSSLTLGSGGSAGSEGPIIQIGSALASGVGQFFRVSGNRLRVIVACGAAAGLASIFNAPIAGVLFALEVVLGEFNVQSFSPIVISSVVATAFSRAHISHGQVIHTMTYHPGSMWEIVFYALMGVVAGTVAVIFVRILAWTEGFFEKRIHLHRALKPAVGALGVGAIGLFYPQVFGYSYTPIYEAVTGQFSLVMLAVLVGMKILATAFTLGSGGSGGILCPSLFIGAMLGGACGQFFQAAFPHMVTDAGAYAIVGMGAMLGAVVQAPMTAIIMVFELTNEYTVILPMMASCILATLVQKTILNGSIYTLSLSRKGIDIDAGREIGILSSLRVRDIMDEHFTAVPPGASYESVLRKCLTGTSNYLYVVDDDNRLEGVISFSDLKEFVFEEELKDLVLARDLANQNLVCVTPDESLASSLNKFSFIDMEQLPVVDRLDGKIEMKGVITRNQLLRAYRQEMLKRVVSQDQRQPRQPLY